jgi:hypothetical protein
MPRGQDEVNKRKRSGDAVNRRSFINALRMQRSFVCFTLSSMTVELGKKLVELSPILGGSSKLAVLAGDNML